MNRDDGPHVASLLPPEGALSRLGSGPAPAEMIAVDTSVLIDLLGEDSRADAAEACLRMALGSGPVAVCDVVVSEVTAGLGRGSQVMDALEEMGLQFSPVEQRVHDQIGRAHV